MKAKNNPVGSNYYLDRNKRKSLVLEEGDEFYLTLSSKAMTPKNGCCPTENNLSNKSTCELTLYGLASLSWLKENFTFYKFTGIARMSTSEILYKSTFQNHNDVLVLTNQCL